MENENIKRYNEEMVKWKDRYKIENKPKEESISQWQFESAMSEPNKPGYEFANND